MRLHRRYDVAAAFVLLGVHTPRDIAGRIVGLPPENGAALLFGSERYGLPPKT